MQESGDVDGLIDVLASTSPRKYGERTDAAWALGAIGDDRAITSLVVALRDKHPFVRGAAADVLDSLGWRPTSVEDGVRYQIGKLSSRHTVSRGSALEALVQYGSEAVAPLIALLGDASSTGLPFYEPGGEVGVRREAVVALSWIGDASVEPLIERLNDPSDAVQRDVIETLGRIGAALAVAPLIAKLDDGDAELRRYATGALANIAALASRNEGVTVAEYDADSPGIHPVVVLDRPDRSWRLPWMREDAWTFRMPDTWWNPADGPTTVQLTAIVDRRQDTLQVCDYLKPSGLALERGGEDVTRLRERVTVTLRTAATGAVLDQTTWLGLEPRRCRSTENAYLTTLQGEPVPLERLVHWLRPYVEGS